MLGPIFERERLEGVFAFNLESFCAELETKITSMLRKPKVVLDFYLVKRQTASSPTKQADILLLVLKGYIHEEEGGSVPWGLSKLLISTQHHVQTADTTCFHLSVNTYLLPNIHLIG